MPDGQASNDGNAATNDAKRPICGIIMPISATINHTEGHWTDVRTLISRAIEKANFTAAPVWENSSVDRVSERIIGNIFQFDLVVADISDSNPNVMLELGLRLASKKPTIVVINSGGNIPFDIRDFHALEYPPSLSILVMEDFIETLASTLSAKFNASLEEGYTPFLGKVVVDVIQPGEREVPLGKYVLDRLDEITARLSNPSPNTRISDDYTNQNDKVYTSFNPYGTTFYFTVTSLDNPTIKSQIAHSFPDGNLHRLGKSKDGQYYGLFFKSEDCKIPPHLQSKYLADFIKVFGGQLGVPSLAAALSPGMQ